MSIENSKELMKLFLDFGVRATEKLIGPGRDPDFCGTRSTRKRHANEAIRNCFNNEELFWGEVDEIRRYARHAVCDERTGRNDLRHGETCNSEECFFQKFAARYRCCPHRPP